MAPVHPAPFGSELGERTLPVGKTLGTKNRLLEPESCAKFNTHPNAEHYDERPHHRHARLPDRGHMADEDYEIVGTATLEIPLGDGGEGPRLTFRGPDLPGVAGVALVMILSYDKKHGRMRVQTGLATEEDEMVVDLANLPEDLQRVAQRVAQDQSSRRLRSPLSVPQCSSLRKAGGDFMTFSEYKEAARSGFRPSRPAALDLPSELLIPYGALYPPLTKHAFDALVGWCRGRENCTARIWDDRE